MIKLHYVIFHCLGGSWEKCVGGGGWRQMYVRTGGIVAKSTRAYKEGEGSVFAIFCVRTKWTTPQVILSIISLASTKTKISRWYRNCNG
jgi:hypothetical protein